MDLKEQQKIIFNYFKIGNFKKALIRSKKLLKKNPDNPGLHNIIGLAYFRLGEIDSSIQYFNNSLKILPNNLSALNNIANAYKKKCNYKKAEQFYLVGFQKDPNYLNNLINFANFKMDINQMDECVDLYNKVLAKDSKNHLIYLNLATAHQAMGNFEEAKKNAQKALDIKPNFTVADRLISSITKYTSENIHFLKLKTKIQDNDINSEDKIYLHFALAKAYYDNKEFKEFFNQVELGNKLKKNSINYNFEKDLNLFKNIKLLFNDIDFGALEYRKSDKKLIFVLGMPRSGTSLVEQIISAHSKVFGAGELPFLLNSFLKNLYSLNKSDKDNVFQNLDKISQNYSEQVSVLNKNNQIVLDKSPLNFLLIGFIRLLFPHSKIIHIKRDSKDNCFSCYRNLFDHGLDFTYDKKELALYYNNYDNLMKFWNKKLGKFIYTVNYETLINDPTSEIKNLLRFCNLDFEEQCSNFHKNKSPVKTLSVFQARRKIYSSSIKSYELFEKDLGEIFDNLKA